MVSASSSGIPSTAAAYALLHSLASAAYGVGMLLTAAQVADLLDVPLRTVQYWAATGRIPHAQKLPGKTGAFLFEKDAVLKATKLRRVIA